MNIKQNKSRWNVNIQIRARFSWKLFGIGQHVARDASTTATLQLPTNLAPTNVKEVVADGTVTRCDRQLARLGICCSPLEETSTMAAQKKKPERTLQNWFEFGEKGRKVHVKRELDAKVTRQSRRE